MMESFGAAYVDIMSIPTTRRHRLIQWKVELEKTRAEKQRQADSQSRSRTRR